MFYLPKTGFQLKLPPPTLLYLTSACTLAVIVLRFALINEVRYNKATSLFVSEKLGRQNTHPKTKVSSNLSIQNCYDQLDQDKLSSYLPQLKSVVSTLVNPIYKFHGLSLNDSLMRDDIVLPSFDCSTWQFHSPSGERNYTRQELLEIVSKDDSDDQIESAELPVPNVAHFILPFRDAELHFHHMVCILSCVWIMQPRLLYLWYSATKPPVGQYWRALRENLSAAGWWQSRVVMVARDPPNQVYGVPVIVAEHQADLMRLEAVLSLGGVYMDLDVLTVKSLRPLRRFPFVIGRETPVGLCNGAFLAERGNLLLAMWHLAYQTFRDRWWALHSVTLPDRLCSPAGGFPHLCHVEEFSMQRPSFRPRELQWIYGPVRVWNWRASNYMVHLWYRNCKLKLNMTSVRRLNSMLGDMFRFVLFGSEALLS